MQFYNPNGLFSEADLLNIKEDLEKLELPEEIIAEKYNCSRAAIYRINSGQTYHNDLWEYPIRKTKVYRDGKNSSSSYFTKEQVLDIYKDLEESILSMKKISEKYNCAPTTISAINNGITYNNPNYIYPIRKERSKRTQPAHNKKVFSQEDIDLIINLLGEGKISMKNIGEMFGCG